MIQELDRLNIDAYHEIVECITSALDARDPYTAGHSERVSDLAQMICGEMGITGECQNDIQVAAHLHDIGKIGIPDAVLNKPERLTDEEWEIMKEHPAIGFDICYQEIEKNLGKMYDPVIGRFVLDNWDKVITVLQKDENSPEVLIQ